MPFPHPALLSRRFLLDGLRTVRRLARQVERRMRYRRLGWV